MIKNLVLAESEAKLSILGDILGREFRTLCVRPDLDFKSISHPPDKFSIYEACSLSSKEQKNLKNALSGVDNIYLAFGSTAAGEAASLFLKQRCHSSGAKITRVHLPLLEKKAILDAFSKGAKFRPKLAEQFLTAEYLNFLLCNTLFAQFQKPNDRLTWLDLLTLWQVDNLPWESDDNGNTITGEFAIGENTFHARLETIKQNSVEIPDNNHFKALLYELENRDFSIEEVQKETLVEHSPGLYDMFSLAEDAIQHLGMSAAQLVKNLRVLFAGEKSWPSLIAFPELQITDRWKPDLQSIRELVMENYGASFVRPNGERELNSPVLFPASMVPPKKVGNSLPADLLGLYDLIWSRTLASEMREAVVEKMTVKLGDKDGLFCFEAQDSRFRQKGFRIVYETSKVISNGLSRVDLAGKPVLKRVLKERNNSRPSFFSQLIDNMANSGLTNPADAVASLAHLENRGFVEFKDGNYSLSDKGKRTVSAISKKNLELFEKGFVRYLSELFQYVSVGKLSAAQGYYEIQKLKSSIKRNEQNEGTGSSSTLGQCPDCGKMLVERTSKFGRFVACSGYPKCKYTRPMSIGVTCPEIGCPGEVVERRTRLGKLFYGCSEYPECNFASWEEPVKMICPQCNYSYMVKKGLEIKCPKCSFKILRSATEAYLA